MKLSDEVNDHLAEIGDLKLSLQSTEVNQEQCKKEKEDDVTS